MCQWCPMWCPYLDRVRGAYPDQGQMSPDATTPTATAASFAPPQPAFILQHHQNNTIADHSLAFLKRPHQLPTNGRWSLRNIWWTGTWMVPRNTLRQSQMGDQGSHSGDGHATLLERSCSAEVGKLDALVSSSFGGSWTMALYSFVGTTAELQTLVVAINICCPQMRRSSSPGYQHDLAPALRPWLVVFTSGVSMLRFFGVLVPPRTWAP